MENGSFLGFEEKSPPVRFGNDSGRSGSQSLTGEHHLLPDCERWANARPVDRASGQRGIFDAGATEHKKTMDAMRSHRLHYGSRSGIGRVASVRSHLILANSDR